MAREHGAARSPGLGFFLFLMTALVALSGLPAQVEGQEGTGSYVRDDSWFQLPAGQQFGNETGITVDDEGMVYTARRCRVNCGYIQKGAPPGDILRFNANGGFATPRAGIVEETHGIHIDREGFLWVTDILGHTVKKYSKDGTLVLTLGTGEPGDGPDTFNAPTDVTDTPNGDIFIADGYGNTRVVKYTNDGQFVKTWGVQGRGPGEFWVPHTIDADARGLVYVGDRCGRGFEDPCSNGRIQIFNGDGEFIAQWVPPGGLGFSPFGIHIDRTSDRLLIGDTENSTIWIVDLETHNVLETIEEVQGMHHLATDSAGNIYVAGLMNGLYRYVRSDR